MVGFRMWGKRKIPKIFTVFAALKENLVTCRYILRIERVYGTSNFIEILLDFHGKKIAKIVRN
jgi:hypothetical protein